ncbi:MAG: hypothetical protein ER33_14720 [Cyanobium sp. CACIAM 14]|nr:MAG: hypothetical protein ER33_14720 [Cyanobium sp. CACIAM 14]
MNPPEQTTPVRRSDWRHALAWIRASRQRTVFAVAVLVVAGLLSACGLLRWQAAFARWSFAFLSWGLAVVVSLRPRPQGAKGGSR